MIRGVVVVGWFFWWRLVRRSCVRLADGSGLLIRGFLRRDVVRWCELIDVDSSESESMGNGMVFSHALVSFAVPAGSPARFAVVSASARSGSADAYTILTWLPEDHPARAALPERTGVGVTPAGPDEAARARVFAAPALAVRRPQLPAVLINLVLEALVLVLPLAGIGTALDPYGGLSSLRTWAAVACALLVISGLGIMARTVRGACS